MGEDSTTQFKENIKNNISLAEEIVAFSNAMGGLGGGLIDLTGTLLQH